MKINAIVHLVKNKPNQSQSVFFTAENAEFAEQKGIYISDCPIKKYNLSLPSLRSSRTRRLIRNESKQSQFRGSSKACPELAEGACHGTATGELAVRARIWPGYLRISRMNRIFFGKRLLFSLRHRAGGVRINKNWCKQPCMCLNEDER